MKFNNRNNSIFALYRLFCAGFMLREVTAPGIRKAHNYPRRQLAYMLTLAHWAKTKHVTYDIMDGNMYMFNEEYGEIFFSTLSRCVLGDNIKADFDHMNKIYKLLPVYRDVQSDIKQDTNRNSDSITWHHVIPIDAPEVTATVFFFSRTIQGILNNTYRSYTRSSKYGTHVVEVTRLTTACTPIVFNCNMSDSISREYADLKKDISGDWVNQHSVLWNDDMQDPDVSDSDAVNMSINQEVDESKSDNDDPIYADWKDCIEGQFAVTLNTWDENKGICVYNITDKCVLPVNADESYAKFHGREWICTKLNTDVRCVKEGAWNFIPRRSKIELINNWSVIAYFPKLVHKKLPKSVVDIIMARHTSSRIF